MASAMEQYDAEQALKNEVSLDDLVNAVKYDSEYANYIPSQEALEYMNLVNNIYGGEFENATPTMHYIMFDALHSGKDVCLVAHRGSGKALSVDERVLTPAGPVPITELSLGDTVYNVKGKEQSVIAISKEFYSQQFDVTYWNGSVVRLCKDHWIKPTKGSLINEDLPHGMKFPKFTVEQCYTYLQNKSHKDGIRTASKGSFAPVDDTAFLIDQPALEYPIQMDGRGDLPMPVDQFALFLKRTLRGELSSRSRQSLFLNKSKFDGLSMNSKPVDLFLPTAYKYGTFEQRLELIRVLTSHQQSKRTAALRTSSVQLADDVVFVIRSLGYNAKRQTVRYTAVNRPPDYLVRIPQVLLKGNRVRLRHKVTDIRRKFVNKHSNKTMANIKNRHHHNNIVDITPVEKQFPVSKCITIGGKHREFLLGDGTASHNSTVMAQNLFFYMAIYNELPNIGRVKFAIYVSDTVKNGCKTMTSNMRYTWTNSEFLRQMIPTAKFTEELWELTNADGDMLSVRVYGAESGIRGGREQNTRPNVAIIDDVLSDKSAASDATLEKVKNTIFKAIEYAMHPTNIKIIIGTPFHARCVVSEACASNQYANVVFPICEKFPCAPEDFRGSWEDRFGYKVVKGIYDKAKSGDGDLTLQGFYQEVMLKPSGTDRRIVDTATMIKRRSREQILLCPEAYMWFITTDFATTDKDASDLSFLLVWAYDDAGVYTIVDGFAAKQLMDANIDKLFEFVAKYPINEVGIEINGQQGGFIRWIYREMQTRNLHFKFATSSVKDKEDSGMPSTQDGIKSIGNKMTRFMSIYPLLTSNSVCMVIEDTNAFYQLELCKELDSITPESAENSRYDDGIDCFSQVGYIQVWKPNYAMPEMTFPEPLGASLVGEHMAERRDKFDTPDNNRYRV